MSSETKTPRTDALENDGMPTTDLCRKLELELTAARKIATAEGEANKRANAKLAVARGVISAYFIHINELEAAIAKEKQSSSTSL
jgi:hypothetical protein